MKVMMVGPIDTKGRYEGGITYILKAIMETAEQYVERGIELDWFDNCRIEREIGNNNAWSWQNFVNAFKTMKDLVVAIKKGNPDIIYYHTSFGLGFLKDLITLKYIKKRCKKKAILHIHYAELNKILPKNFILRKLSIKLLISVPDYIVLLSEETRKEIVSLGIQEKNCSTIYNFHAIYIEEKDIVKKVNIVTEKDKQELIFMGSIDERKGILDLLDALKMLEFPYILHVCGIPTDDNIRRLYEKKVGELKKGSVVSHGYVRDSEKKDILMQSDVMILPSYGEGFPIVLLEGIAVGCAIITTNVGAIPEVFGEKTGIIFEPGDVKSLSDALNEINNRRNLKETMLSNYRYSIDFRLDSFNINIMSVCIKLAYEMEK